MNEEKRFCLLTCLLGRVDEGRRVGEEARGGRGNIFYYLFNPKVIFCPAPAPGLLCSALLCSVSLAKRMMRRRMMRRMIIRMRTTTMITMHYDSTVYIIYR